VLIRQNCRKSPLKEIHVMPRAVTPLLILALAGSAFAQSANLDARTAGTETATAPQSPTAPPTTDLGGYRLPLLREGSVLSRVIGDLTQDPDEKLWLFRPSSSESSGLRREFVLLPSPTLEDMLQTVRVSAVPVEFELSGRVFIFRGRNFLLAELAPPIVRFDTEPGTKPTTTAVLQPTPSGEGKFVAPTSGDADERADQHEDEAVADIERRLEERIGRAPTRRLPEIPGAQRVEAGEAAKAPVANGERLTLRRGRLLRDPQAGSWRFVPEQFTGRGDVSMEILPCLLLEQLERSARESDAPPVILISGSVLAFEGRSYLLPSSFRIAREGRGLNG